MYRSFDYLLTATFRSFVFPCKAFESQTQSDTGKWTMICGLASAVVMVAGSFKASTATDGYVGYVVELADKRVDT